MSSQLSANFVHCPNRKLHTSENAGLKSANKRLQRHVPTLLTGLPFGFCFCQYLCNTQFNRLTGKSLNKTRILCRRLALISKTENGPILLVEDDASDEFMTLRALKTNHVKNEVVVCRDGAEALDYLFETGKYAWQGTAMPELILLDLKLPKLDGLEVLRGIRADERTRFLPVIIITSSDDELDRTKSYGLGIVTYIRKPVDFRKLLQAVFQSGLHWLLMDEPSDCSHSVHT